MANVLVVEDDSAFRDLISMTLRRAGHTSILAENGQQALETFARLDCNIAALITDFSMPGMSGIQLVRALRESSPTLKTILISGHWINPIPEDLNIEFMIKPFPMSKLTEKVKRLINSDQLGI